MTTYETDDYAALRQEAQLAILNGKKLELDPNAVLGLVSAVVEAKKAEDEAFDVGYEEGKNDWTASEDDELRGAVEDAIDVLHSESYAADRCAEALEILESV